VQTRIAVIEGGFWDAQTRKSQMELCSANTVDVDVDVNVNVVQFARNSHRKTLRDSK
jgi:hypothetical protein